ncbi:hypothetical protein C8R46DRAFT_1029380 [Mycena filopes]|nr:hypothetical protein C8R46DRAFT_1029380 [Mycena filopes]
MIAAGNPVAQMRRDCTLTDSLSLARSTPAAPLPEIDSAAPAVASFELFNEPGTVSKRRLVWRVGCRRRSCTVAADGTASWTRSAASRRVRSNRGARGSRLKFPPPLLRERNCARTVLADLSGRGGLAHGSDRKELFNETGQSINFGGCKTHVFVLPGQAQVDQIDKLVLAIQHQIPEWLGPAYTVGGSRPWQRAASGGGSCRRECASSENVQQLVSTRTPPSANGGANAEELGGDAKEAVPGADDCTVQCIRQAGSSAPRALKSRRQGEVGCEDEAGKTFVIVTGDAIVARLRRRPRRYSLVPNPAFRLRRIPPAVALRLISRLPPEIQIAFQISNGGLYARDGCPGVIYCCAEVEDEVYDDIIHWRIGPDDIVPDLRFKIGSAKNLTHRMLGYRECDSGGHKRLWLFSFETRQRYRLERLNHLAFDCQHKRDVAKCSGCGTRHHEFWVLELVARSFADVREQAEEFIRAIGEPIIMTKLDHYHYIFPN